MCLSDNSLKTKKEKIIITENLKTASYNILSTLTLFQTQKLSPKKLIKNNQS